jgi:hypothetical protein
MRCAGALKCLTLLTNPSSTRAIAVVAWVRVHDDGLREKPHRRTGGFRLSRYREIEGGKRCSSPPLTVGVRAARI